MMLAKLKMPIVTGVIRALKDDTFEIRLKKQVEEIERTSRYKSVNDLFTSGETWEIKK
jgi:2-oxoglutarate/2-oxoacid ferredoxin oxidoreductase subunit beta